MKTQTSGHTLLSHLFQNVIVRITFVVKSITGEWDIGLISEDQTQKCQNGTKMTMNNALSAAWSISKRRSSYQNGKPSQVGTACQAGEPEQQVVLEADGRDEARTLKLSQNGETQPVFFTNIPVPFRLAILPFTQNDSIEIVSSEVVKEPLMKGGMHAVKMDDKWKWSFPSLKFSLKQKNP